MRNKITKLFGIDSAILYTIAGRLIQGVGGIIAVYFIAIYLNLNEQGYYYTFGSILALQVFFELGLSNIITQFTSKYFVGLEIDNEKIIGDDSEISYLTSILTMSIKWFTLASILLFFGLSIVGTIFFYKTQTDQVKWFYPWIMTCGSTAFLLLSTPFIAFISGLNKITFTAKLRFWQYFVQLMIMILFFVMDFGLYARPFSIMVSVLVVYLFLYKSTYFKLIVNLMREKVNDYKVSYKKDIFPYQWKITISWLSGYLIFQLFNPIIFAFDGSIAAGKMGMTLVMLTGIQTVAISWVSTKVPLFAQLATSRNFETLDLEFGKVNFQSTFFCFIGLLLFLIFRYLLDEYHISYATKFLDLKNTIILSLATIANHIMTSLATYLRSYLKEPLTLMSVVSGILVASSSILFGNYYGVNGVVISYSLVMCIVCVPWTFFLYKKNKFEWQNLKAND